jgi:hypothetical protein
MKIQLSLLVAGLALCVVGVALIGAGESLGLPRPAPAGGLVIGIGIVMVGLDGIIRARSTEGVGVMRVTHYGWSARFRGMGFALMGLIAIAGSLVELGGKGNWQHLLGTPAGHGLIVLVLGLFALTGSGMLMAERPRGSSLLALPGRIAGALLLALGLIATATGLLMIVAPGTVEAWMRQLLGTISSSG